jgi:hypothetical protein
VTFRLEEGRKNVLYMAVCWSNIKFQIMIAMLGGAVASF